ncbi:FAD-dependent monooxygenase [Bacillus sp. FJAT-29790]|uniref:FAD-dependent monooxygenase n=1 Tax=Bacillus sp. FJAT-29790 TaxID=1895002 RepID=UPI001C247214|nr:FAD-dependent monooxygenase [Bacillus sp. FJAT-29790]MBU8879811.1 FAD-dependent monooxygenase [Bacillus sp. FJAT-29790]
MTLKYDVCIVGAGPGGALLGYLLAKNNISTIVVERHEGIDKEFRGEHLNNVGEEVLKEFNLFEKVERQGLLLMERIEYWDHGKVIKTVTPAHGNKHVGIHVPQRNLLSVLIRESEKYHNYRLMLGTKVTELITDEKGAVTGIKAKKDDKELTITSSIVIGADGRYSTIRKLANMPFNIIKHGYDLLWAKIPSPTGWEPTIKQTLIDNKQLALFTQAGGFIQIGWNIKEGSYPQLRKQSFEPFIKRVTAAFPELSTTIRKHIISWNNFILLQVQSCYCETWVKDGLVIMGDAAHTMSPTGALGINCALKDASILCEVIKEALDQKDTSVHQLIKFENGRRDEIEKLQTHQMIQEASYKSNFAVS